MLDIISIALGGVLCGAEGWTEIEQFGPATLPGLGPVRELPHAIPSPDTVGRVVAALDPARFQRCCLGWVQAVVAQPRGQASPGPVVARAGKTLRRSPDRTNGKAAIHLVSAWATEHRLVRGQVKVDDPSNAIAALPEPVQRLALRGCIVTIDARGCQAAIAQAIIAQGADDALALTGNQPTLAPAVQALVADAQATGFQGLADAPHTTVAPGQGRRETRRCGTISEPAPSADRNEHGRWTGVRRSGMLEAERGIGETTTRDTRYVIGSLPGAARQFGPAVRAHWGLEDRLHWAVEMVFPQLTEGPVRAVA